MKANPRTLAWVGGFLLLLAVLVATTSDGPKWSGVSSGSRFETSQQSSAPDPSSEPDGMSGASPDRPSTDGEPGRSNFTRTTAATILIVALILLIAVLVVRLRLVGRRRTLTGAMRPRAAVATEDNEDDPDPDDELVHEVDHRLRSVTEGSPRNAIVATWIGLLEATEAAGFDQRDAETPTEFIRRALTTYRVDEDAISRLADLYREARFSEHELTERRRDEAASCLRQLRAQLIGSGVR